MTVTPSRRQVLASLAALSPTGDAGCVGVVQDLSSEPRQWGFEATVVEAPTTESPGVVELSLTNESAVDATPYFGPLAPFSAIRSVPGAAGHRLVLLPTSNPRVVNPAPNDLLPAESADGCWRLAGPFEIADSVSRRRVRPGETVGRKYRVCSGPETGADGCPTGTYAFENNTVRKRGSIRLRYGVGVRRGGPEELAVEPTDVTVEIGP